MPIHPASRDYPVCEVCKTDLTEVIRQYGEIGAEAHHAKHAIEHMQRAIGAAEALANAMDIYRPSELTDEARHAKAWFRQQVEICEQMGVVPRERIIDMEQVS